MYKHLHIPGIPHLISTFLHCSWIRVGSRWCPTNWTYWPWRWYWFHWSRWCAEGPSCCYKLCRGIVFHGSLLVLIVIWGGFCLIWHCQTLMVDNNSLYWISATVKMAFSGALLVRFTALWAILDLDSRYQTYIDELLLRVNFVLTLDF